MSTRTPLTTWAKNHTYPARAVHEPTSVEQVQDLVAGARRIRAVGSRHCFNDIVDSEELINLDALPTRIEIDESARTVTVAAGTRYGTLASRLHARGWALHTLASLPHISVAGAVATATHGSGDRSGNLATAVRGLDLVTADGSLLTLRGAELTGTVVGLGALGVVTAVTLEIEPTYDVVQTVDTDLPWDAALESYEEIAASADSVSLFTDWRSPTIAQVWRKTRVTERATDRAAGPRRFGAVPATGQLHPVTGGDPAAATAQLGVPGPWHERLPHFRMAFTPSHGEELQSEYLVPRRHATEALAAVRALADLVAPLLLVSEIRTVAADDLWLSTAYGTASVGIHFTWQRRQAEVTAVLPRLEEALAPFGARPHWGKLFADVDRALAPLYPRMADFRAVAGRLDPAGTFRNAYLERHVLG